MLDLLTGVRRAGPMVNLAAAGAANTGNVFIRSTNYVGNTTMIVRKVRWRNNAVGANTFLHIGTGTAGAFVDAIPPILTLNGLDDSYQETEIPGIVELAATITAYVDAVGAGSVDVQVEVEERR